MVCRTDGVHVGYVEWIGRPSGDAAGVSRAWLAAFERESRAWWMEDLWDGVGFVDYCVASRRGRRYLRGCVVGW